MRETNTKIKKSVFRILIFIIGGVFTIIGILFEIFTLVKMPGDAFTIMPYFVLAILIMSVGLYLCFYTIKQANYSNKLHKMSIEENIIGHIKKSTRHSKKSEILVVTIFLLISTTMLISILIIEIQVTKTISTQNMKLVGLIHLAGFQYMAAIFSGALFAALTNEISGFSRRNKHKLTLSMWKRIGELEDELKELKAGTQAEGQQKSDVNGEDTA